MTVTKPFQRILGQLRSVSRSESWPGLPWVTRRRRRLKVVEVEVGGGAVEEEAAGDELIGPKLEDLPVRYRVQDLPVRFVPSHSDLVPRSIFFFFCTL
ncbi:hypothetical protein RchiOBHm_Chr2g0138061 [Rosa chinensis]|uniref:Uncharacterized protein n=1 Tax=Rosa chinensis TaxID=74649 RepID=A0A2P6RWR9_ROSCH|nr:hypothetical protein RchiOBHm_Chr2g0138061 [Rosa chinensis]